ncbi:related to CRH1 - family of putative glycosidases might exert a common role in cell wall organization [Fusarium torulosum]|uniref:Crh-like protein n=1 Tax=Fusarium torulosum TaxID=33205 RepID=A0AAE8MFX9_9HYPO|nr:related to CRH1 - family of putative glycosidases might exert a common role in cell wall organization [Fusarium torulosum]
MFTKAFSAAAMALACAGMISAQTFTDCNPLKKTCPPNPAFGDKKVECDFAKGECDAFHSMIGTNLKYSEQGALFSINKETDAPTIRSNNYLFFGRVDIVMEAAKGQGIVTSVVLQSDDLDEIDFEMVGGDDAQVQTNYFSKGDTTTYDRAIYHPVSAPLSTTHKYSVEWTSTKIDWLIDDVVVRTLNAADATRPGYQMPQTPMQLKLGTWVAGGKNSNEGTREWAGGYTNFKEAPFNAYYRSITIIDYAGKDAPGQAKGAKEYVWSDKSGSFTSIKVKNTLSGNGDEEETTTSSTVSKVSKTTKTAEPTKTKTHEATTTSKAEETTSAAESKTKSAEKESKTESAKESKTESVKETKTTEAATTFSTAAASTKAEAAATATEGSGSSSGSGSSADSGADAATATGPATVTDRPSGTTPVPVNSGSRMAGNLVAAVAGLMLAQILI